MICHEFQERCTGFARVTSSDASGYLYVKFPGYKKSARVHPAKVSLANPPLDTGDTVRLKEKLELRTFIFEKGTIGVIEAVRPTNSWEIGYSITATILLKVTPHISIRANISLDILERV